MWTTLILYCSVSQFNVVTLKDVCLILWGRYVLTIGLFREKEILSSLSDKASTVSTDGVVYCCQGNFIAPALCTRSKMLLLQRHFHLLCTRRLHGHHGNPLSPFGGLLTKHRPFHFLSALWLVPAHQP